MGLLIVINFRPGGGLEGDKGIRAKNDLTEGPRDLFWSENLTSVAREVFRPKKVEGTRG